MLWGLDHMDPDAHVSGARPCSGPYLGQERPQRIKGAGRTQLRLGQGLQSGRRRGGGQNTLAPASM